MSVRTSRTESDPNEEVFYYTQPTTIKDIMIDPNEKMSLLNEWLKAIKIQEIEHHKKEVVYRAWGLGSEFDASLDVAINCPYWQPKLILILTFLTCCKDSRVKLCKRDKTFLREQFKPKAVNWTLGYDAFGRVYGHDPNQNPDFSNNTTAAFAYDQARRYRLLDFTVDCDDDHEDAILDDA